MDGVRDALLRMVKTSMFLKKMAEAYTVLGLDDNPHHQAFGDLCDAIYSLVGEHTEEFDKSVTWIAVNAPFLCDERRVQLLMSEYEKHHCECPNYEPKQPKPNTMPRECVEKMACENGGYVAQKASVLPPEERGLKRENHRLKRVNKILMDKLCGAAVEVCMGCKCCKSEDVAVRSNCDMCDYAYLKERKLPPNMTKEFLP